MQSKIYCFGISHLDIILPEPATWPSAGQMLNCESMELSLGGVGLNTTVALSRLGEKPYFITSLGNDFVGVYLKEELRKCNVDLSFVNVQETNNGICLVFNTKGKDRSLIRYSGADIGLVQNQTFIDHIQPNDYFLISGGNSLQFPTISAYSSFVRSISQRGAIIAFDASWDTSGRWWKVIMEFVRHLDYFVCNEMEIEALTGLTDPVAASEYIFNAGAKNVVIKLGSKGSFGFDGKYSYFVDPFKVNSINSSGAGDSYFAGLLYSIKCNADFYHSLRFANAVGALSTTSNGPFQGVPKAKDVEEFISNYQRIYSNE